MHTPGTYIPHMNNGGGPATASANAPSVEDFLAQQHDPSEDDWADAITDEPLVSIAHSLSLLTEVLTRHAQIQTLTITKSSRPITVHEAHSPAETAREIAGMAMVPVTDHDALREERDTWHQEYDDLYEHYNTALGVIADVEAALGKSTAKPALAAKAVIEAWKSPKVEEVEPEVPEGETEPSITPVTDDGPDEERYYETPGDATYPENPPTPVDPGGALPTVKFFCTPAGGDCSKCSGADCSHECHTTDQGGA